VSFPHGFGGNPQQRDQAWIPACAGMTKIAMLSTQKTFFGDLSLAFAFENNTN
jgi:hypothetical protein